MATRQDYVDKIRNKLKLSEGLSDSLTDGDITEALDSAVDHYSYDKPRERLHVISGSGTHRYALPSDWESGFSHIVYVEFPAGSNAAQDPSILDPDEVFVWEDNSAEQFQFRFRSLSTGDTAWVKYTVRHTMDGSSNTVPDADLEAVVFLGTAYAALMQAGSLIAEMHGDTGGFGPIRTRSDHYKALAQELFKRYYRRLGVNETLGVKPTLEIFSLDYELGHGLGPLVPKK